MSLDETAILLRYFKPPEQSAFLSLEHAPSLKGLFKGKGEWEECASEWEQLRDALIMLGRESVLPQVKAYPFALLPVELAIQTTGAGTAFLRWRKKDRSVMGVHLWEALMTDPCVSDTLINDLYAIEMQRIELNMQISVVHTMMRRFEESAQKAAHAKHVYQKRMMK